MQNFHFSFARRAGARLSVSAWAVLACWGVGAVAGAQAAQSGGPVLAETVVTATRSPSALQDTLADVTVITRAQLQASAPGRTVAEVLQRLAGVQLSAYGARGQLQNVFLRGSNSGHVLLLVDGVRYGSATSGGPALENLPLELIERIEVVKGPMSALYGSEAVGGVIQVFTQRGQGAQQPLQAQAEGTLGEYGHKSASAALSGAQAGWDYQLSLSRVLEHGLSATSPESGPFTYHPDRDAFDQTAAHLALGYALNADWRVEGTLLRSDGRAFTDDGPDANNPYTDMRSDVSRVALKGVVLPHWTTTLAVGHSSDHTRNRQAAWGDSHFRTRQTSYHWDNQIATPWGTLLAGLERLEQKVDTSSVYSVTERHINAAFVGLTGQAGRHHWQGNLRRDDNSQFGGFTTYGLSYGLDVGAGLRLLAGHGKSLRAPTFNDLYGTWSAPYTGNPLLQPERGKSYEWGVQWQQAGHSAKLLRHDNRVDQLIAAGMTQMENVPGTTRLKGWSASYGFAQDGWHIAAAFDYLNARQADGQTPLRRAKQQWSLQVDRQWGAWRMGANVLHVGSRGDSDFASFPAAPVRLSAYTTVDAHAQYQLTPALALQLRVANLGDKQYQTAYGYQQLGRAGYVTLRWQMR